MDENNKNNSPEIIYEYEKPKGKKLPIFIIFLVVIGLSSLFYVYKDNFIKNEITPGIDIKDSQLIVDKKFISGLRLASIGRYDEAISAFNEIKFNDLSESDKYIVLNAYLKAGETQKALDLDSSFDKEVIQDYFKNNKLEKLKELKSDSKLIEFEIAVLDNDYAKIIELRNVDGLDKDVRRANAIANAYYMLGEKEEAVNFTSLMVFDGINVWDKNLTEVNPLSTQTSPNNNSSEPSSTISFFVSIVMLLIGFLIGVLLFFIIPKFKSKLTINKGKKSNIQEVKVNKEDSNIETAENNNVENADESQEGSEEEKKYSYHYEE